MNQSGEKMIPQRKVEKWLPFLAGSDWDDHAYMITRRTKWSDLNAPNYLYNELIIAKNFCNEAFDRQMKACGWIRDVNAHPNDDDYYYRSVRALKRSGELKNYLRR